MSVLGGACSNQFESIRIKRAQTTEHSRDCHGLAVAAGGCSAGRGRWRQRAASEAVPIGSFAQTHREAQRDKGTETRRDNETQTRRPGDPTIRHINIPSKVWTPTAQGLKGPGCLKYETTHRVLHSCPDPPPNLETIARNAGTLEPPVCDQGPCL